MHYLIYKITNRLNNKIYVGKHKTENKDDDYFGSGVILSRSVEKHGKENFTKEILFECSSEEEMNKKEADIVDEEFISRDDTYNVMLGGQGGFDYINQNKLTTGYSKSKDELSRMGSLSIELRQERFEENPELKRELYKKVSTKLRLWNLNNKSPWDGRNHSDESKEKMRAAKKGKFLGKDNPSFGTMWITDGSINTKIKKTDQIPFGFRKGRINK